MYTFRAVGGILLILLLKKLFHKVTDDASARRNDDAAEASSSATQDCDSSDSSSSDSGKEYEVFLSFRGEDTRTTFTDYLYQVFDIKGIHTFRDNEKLQKGEKIAKELKSAIHRSKIAVIIFSKGYASSKWCLHELAEISRYREKEGQTQIIVLPVFYHVDPSDVRNQTGCYGAAFRHHEKKFDKKTLEEWRKALKDIGELKGWDLKNTADGHEGKLVRLIVEEVWSKLEKIPLTISEDVVGMDSHVEKIEELLSIESKRIVGIHGLGGIGKTTIARCVYNKVYCDFQGWCFLEDVRETTKTKGGIVHLQTQLVNNILNEKDINVSSVHEGTALIKQRLSSKKVLIVLDDVDRDTDLNAIIGKDDWFGVGSKIIITTRDKRVLDELGVDNIYKPNEMNPEQSLVLFSRHAFKMNDPPEKYSELTRDVIRTTRGLPLALKVIGSSLYLREERAWKEVLKKLASTPHEKVQEILKISYDELDNEEKVMFLDIACFFIGTKKDTACYMWEGSNFAPHLGIENLCLKSLIEINERNEFSMHDHLRDLGREIVRERNPEKIGKRSRLWSHEDVKEILSTQQGTKEVEGLQYTYYSKDENMMIEGFGAMIGLRILKLKYAKVAGNLKHSFANLRYLSWKRCPMQFVPTNLKRLCVLDLSHSGITERWEGWQYIKEAKTLKVLKLSWCYKLCQIPNLSAHTLLEVLKLDDCRQLVGVESIVHLKSLVTLDMRNCRSVGSIPNKICELTSLRILDLRQTGIHQLPEKWVQLEALKELHFDFSEIQLLCLPNLQILSTGLYSKYGMRESEKTNIIPLPELPPHLRYLDASKCKMESLPPSLPNLTKLENLYLAGCPNLVELPIAINALSRLKSLSLVECPQLKCIPHLHLALQSLFIRSCENLGEILGFLGMRNLESLEVRDCSKLAKIESLEGLDSLHLLVIHDCPSLEKLPQLKALKKSCKLKLMRNGLSEIEGLEGLEDLYVEDCNFLRIIPDLSGSENLVRIEIDTCEKLSEMVGLDKLDSLQLLKIRNCPSLVKLPKLESLKKSCELKLTRNGLSEIEGLEGLKELHVEHCNFLRIIPDLSGSENLVSIKILYCENLSEMLGLEKLDSLRLLHMTCCPSLVKLPKLESLKIKCEFSLYSTGLKIFNCGSLRIISDLSDSKNLVSIEIRDCHELSDIVGLEKLSSLKKLDALNCPSLRLRKLPERLCELDISLNAEPFEWRFGPMKALKVLTLRNLPAALGINFFEALESLEKLEMITAKSLLVVPDLSPLKNLKCLCLCFLKRVTEILGVSKLESLEKLEVWGCKSIEIFPNISDLTKLSSLEIKSCKKLTTIQGLDRLENLRELMIDDCNSIGALPCLDRLENLVVLNIIDCNSIEALPCLSNSKKLQSLEILCCGKLAKIQGLESLENLEELDIIDCSSIEALPCLSNSKKLQSLQILHCQKLAKIQGLESLENLERLDTDEHIPLPSNLEELWGKTFRREIAIRRH